MVSPLVRFSFTKLEKPLGERFFCYIILVRNSRRFFIKMKLYRISTFGKDLVRFSFAKLQKNLGERFFCYLILVRNSGMFFIKMKLYRISTFGKKIPSKKEKSPLKDFSNYYFYLFPVSCSTNSSITHSTIKKISTINKNCFIISFALD